MTVAGVTELLVRRLMDAVNAHDIDALLACYSPEVRNHGRTAGHAGMRLVHEAIFTAFPDWRIEVVDLQVGADRAVARCALHGTHHGAVTGPLAERLFGGVLDGLEPAGTVIRVDAFHAWDLEGDLVVAHWAVRDDLSMWRQLRGTPGP